jgi:tripartite-type tricarboxylate transporter receptor subunit TctC
MARWENSVVGLLCLAASAVQAQTYPVRPIRLIVPYPAAGPNDMLARSINDALGKRLGQSVIIDNRGGAATVIGAEIVASAPPDGYTLLLATVTTLAVAPALATKRPFDPERDFVPISMLGAQPYLMGLHPSVPATTIQQLIAYAKANPGKLSFASPGVGTSAHLAGEMFKHMADINVVHVPYKGGGPALNDLMAGQVAYMFGGVSGLVPHRQSGKVRLLGVTSLKRSPAAPDVPTIAESGLTGFSTSTWNSLVAPRGTAKAIVDKINTDVNAVLNQPEVRERLVKQGIDVEGGTPAQLQAHVKAEIARYNALIKTIGLKNLQ